MSLGHDKIHKLQGFIQHYAWGGYDFIPELLGKENTAHQPFAEYWLGAHPNHSSTIDNESKPSLADLINKDPSSWLGKKVFERFTSLPYLFKVLDVRHMLSIQVHPSIRSAETGFDEENKKGIALSAPHRNYKDRNHKPEMMVALNDFWLLHGFKKEEELEKKINAVPEWKSFKKIFQAKGYAALYEEVMFMEQQELNEKLHPVVQRILPLYEKGQLKKDDEDFWAARAAKDFCKNENYDRGIFSIYFFNLVHLKKGEGIFQPAGMPHAYLEGQNVELMANSDNVLRAGLTEKYVDVEELMKHIDFKSTTPNILDPANQSGCRVFKTPAEEFELQQYQLKAGDEVVLQSESGEIILLIQGSGKWLNENEEMTIKKGDSFFILPGANVRIQAQKSMNLFRVGTPGN